VRAVKATPWLVRALLVVPALVVLSVGFGWWSARNLQHFSAARVFISGQASELSHDLHLRVLCLRSQGEREVPEPGCVRVEGATAAPSVACSNDEGVVSFNLHRDAPRSQQDVIRFFREADSTLLAEGRVRDFAVSPAPVVRRGGEIEGRRDGALEISVGVVQGVLAVPFAGRVRVLVRHAGQPLEAELTLSATGAAASERALTSGVEGAVIDLTPSDFAVELSITARTRVGSLEGRWLGLLPVVPGASWATLEGNELVVRSPIARGTAYVDLIQAGIVVRSLDLPLQVDEAGAGVASARWPLEAVQPKELFAVVSSEPDFQSMALVGWPLPVKPEVNATWDVRSRLALDGVAQNRATARSAKRVRVGVGFAAVCVGACVEAALFWLLWRRTNAAAGELSGALETPSWAWRLGLLLCLLLGLLGLGLFGLLRG
jgi:hypothetical protein